ncbi:hypothetical protein [Streptomyces sp. NPDC051684]|uniref:hypothetical protein n=1 Tax=Streptomyces sp. NPDC051684 TaxID=3365670 RepID=UPI00378BBFF4
MDGGVHTDIYRSPQARAVGAALADAVAAADPVVRIIATAGDEDDMQTVRVLSHSVLSIVDQLHHLDRLLDAWGCGK